jgi:hypothetical protein
MPPALRMRGRWRALKMLGKFMMSYETILYISGHTVRNDPNVAALEAAGYEVLSASPTQAVALLFVLHCIGVVVLNQEAEEQGSLDVVGSLRTICRDIPILMLVREEPCHLPPGVEVCLNARQALEQLTSAVSRLLVAKLVS